MSTGRGLFHCQAVVCGIPESSAANPDIDWLLVADWWTDSANLIENSGEQLPRISGIQRKQLPTGNGIIILGPVFLSISEALVYTATDLLLCGRSIIGSFLLFLLNLWREVKASNSPVNIPVKGQSDNPLCSSVPYLILILTFSLQYYASIYIAVF